MLELEQAEAAAPAMVPSRFRVERKRRETSDTYTLEMTPANGEGPPRFAPGQFNMLYVFGKGEVPISISGDPVKPGRLVHTVRSVGIVTQAINALARGQTVGVRGPFGSAWPVAEAKGKDLLIVAGGIGLAPLRPVVYHALKKRRDYRRVSLLYGSRTPGDLLYTHELEKWRGRFDFDVHVTVDAAGADWRGHVGVVTRLIPAAEFEPTETVALVCGPEIMMRFTVRGLLERGIAPEAIYLSVERNMKCALGLCGHCQFGPEFICKDGPVFQYTRIERFLNVREL